MADRKRRFEGKRALVTGASGGIGRGIAEALAAEGAKVWNFDLIQTEIPGVKTIQVDLTDWDATRKCLDKVGSIDLLVNNAGIANPPDDMVDITKETLDKILAVNFKAPFHIGQLVAKDMIKTGKGGSIVNMSSITAFCTALKYSPYCISKAGLQMMTKCMALELGPHKIRVNTVNPTIVTDSGIGVEHGSDEQKVAPLKARTPLGRLALIEDVVKATLFLLGEDASMITGSALPVDGGYLVC